MPLDKTSTTGHTIESAPDMESLGDAPQYMERILRDVAFYSARGYKLELERFESLVSGHKGMRVKMVRKVRATEDKRSK